MKEMKEMKEKTELIGLWLVAVSCAGAAMLLGRVDIGGLILLGIVYAEIRTGIEALDHLAFHAALLRIDRDYNALEITKTLDALANEAAGALDIAEIDLDDIKMLPNHGVYQSAIKPPKKPKPVRTHYAMTDLTGRILHTSVQEEKVRDHVKARLESGASCYFVETYSELHAGSQLPVQDMMRPLSPYDLTKPLRARMRGDT